MGVFFGCFFGLGKKEEFSLQPSTLGCIRLYDSPLGWFAITSYGPKTKSEGITSEFRSIIYQNC